MTVFVDTTVIMYAAGQDHPHRSACRTVIDRAANGEIDAVTSAEVVQEILHRFTLQRRHRLGHDIARHTLDVFAPVLPVTHAVMERTADLALRYTSLPARDLVHVATCLEVGIDAIVTTDADFDAVREVNRIAPADVKSLGR